VAQIGPPGRSVPPDRFSEGSKVQPRKLSAGWERLALVIVAIAALYRRMPIAAVVGGVYLAGSVALCVYLGIPLVPDRLIVLFLPVVLLFGRIRSFVRDWLPFLIVLFAYEYLRGFGGSATARANFITMLALDRRLFGVVPTEWLQQRFFDSSHLHWWDYAATLVYFMHFVAPLAFGLVLWLTRPYRFARFAAGLLGLSVMGLATYLLFPAAPPWMAAQHGLLHVQQVLSYTLGAFPDRVQLPTIYSMFDPDTVAAVPSLHAAYSLLIALFAARFFGRRAIPALLYPLAMWTSLVYMGEHYVSDVICGGVYALAAFVLTEYAIERRIVLGGLRRWAPALGSA
jgi:membrane-associated phospholipid phosphatase